MKEKKEREYGKATLAIHREIRGAVDRLAEDGNLPCVLVSAVEKAVGKDKRTVKFHLELLEEANYGKLDKNGKMFCLKKEKNTRKTDSG